MYKHKLMEGFPTETVIPENANKETRQLLEGAGQVTAVMAEMLSKWGSFTPPTEVQSVQTSDSPVTKIDTSRQQDPETSTPESQFADWILGVSTLSKEQQHEVATNLVQKVVARAEQIRQEMSENNKD